MADSKTKDPKSNSQRLLKALDAWAKRRGLEGGAEKAGETIINTAVDEALDGNHALLKVLLNLLVPKTETFVELPELAQATSADPLEHMRLVWQSVVSGKLSVETGKELLTMAKTRFDIVDAERYLRFAQDLSNGRSPQQAAAELLGRPMPPAPQPEMIPMPRSFSRPVYGNKLPGIPGHSPAPPPPVRQKLNNKTNVSPLPARPQQGNA